MQPLLVRLTTELILLTAMAKIAVKQVATHLTNVLLSKGYSGSNCDHKSRSYLYCYFSIGEPKRVSLLRFITL